MITLLQLGTELGRSFYPASGTTFRANPVTGVHISELADPTPYLEGGELLLTTGMSFADTAEASTEYLGRLAAHGITSLGLGLGPWLDEVPSWVAAGCQRLGIQLGVVPDEVPFQQVSRAYWRLSARSDASNLMESLGTQTALARAANRADADSSVIRELARALGGWAAYLRVDDGPEAHWPASAAVHLAQLRQECRRFARVDMPSAATFEIAGEAVVVYPILSGPRLTGYLAVCADRPVTRAERQVMMTVATLLSMRARQRATEQEARRELGAAVTRLLLHGEHHAAVLVGDQLGLDRQLQAPVRLLAATLPQTEAHDALRQLEQLAPDPRLAWRLPALSTHRLALREAGTWYLVLSEPSAGEPAVRPAPAPGEPAPSRHACAVLSEPVGLAEIPGILPGVRLALSQAPPGMITGAGGETEATAAGWVRTLREYQRSDLLPAVRAYLASRGTWEEAARQLGIHRNSLRLRIATAGKLLQQNLDDPDVAARLWLAIRREEP